VNNMVNLFDSTTIKSLTMENRFVRSATGTGMATEKGEVTPNLTKHIMELVEGGVGLIISGHACVHPSGRTEANQLSIYNDSNIPGLTSLVEKAHNQGGKIVAQLNHGGAHSNSSVTGMTPISSSTNYATGSDCHTMSQNEIDQVIYAFRDASDRAKKAGFDGVQIHGAHGYLLSQFLSPIYNEREDEYGGSIPNRTRIVVETFNEIRDIVGNDYPIMIKMNVTDFLDEGISMEDAIEIASIFEKVGFDAIELSGGVIWGWTAYGYDRSPCRTISEEAYFLEESKRLKQTLKTPIIITGGIKTHEVAEKIINDGDADYIGLCRPLIREPDLVNRWKSGDTSPSLCIHDNACLFSEVEIACSQLS
jgi:2,4-dienoyl-CoA reductase-like NADH-dependent reductase (Old Yellow Enzyme family)